MRLRNYESWVPMAWRGMGAAFRYRAGCAGELILRYLRRRISARPIG